MKNEAVFSFLHRFWRAVCRAFCVFAMLGINRRVAHKIRAKQTPKNVNLTAY